ncbi:MAG: enoyl-CoA hydratase/isomerase family protein [Alphaproteobacteria bacterium]|nr:enoyl-CoA hydratase/isomerase family protein [Alphaproteobacteria bacterium]MBU1514137.1 enoyl-CoA hydratase/isomerase family protein [Alphaproteobacteria bacterium]MBU2096214.1 enoyl-CoA hydratase/isomerase family protein [Alphaproteobacteria bacterium]MBU2151168.1 enoyl-CoA hydratase/isomerase family protein [Alphaproteobacteria bacterium]MBU2307173.1 enoyl-CoA hydratase/isomerase family protein [Alphaproteobacteria bacterium]
MKQAYGDHVKVAMDGHVAVVTLDRPPHNFVSVEFMGELADAMEAADASNDVRAIVLQAEGRTFSGGADFASPTDKVASGMAGVNALYDQAVRLFSIETPIVAAIQGSAVGAGLGLAMVADFRVASPEARFGGNFVKLGFHPGFGLTHTLPRVVGQQRANLMFLTGRRIKAEEGLAWGLVDEVVPAEELRCAALKLAQEIAENAPLAVISTRKTLRAQLAADVRAQTDIEHREQTILRATEDFAEGVRSVAERRAGNFAGR